LRQPVHYGHRLFMHLHIFGVVGQHQGNARAHALGVSHPRARFHAKNLGLDAGRNATRRIGHHRHHPHRSPAQSRVELLLDRSEVAVEVDEEGAEHGRLTVIMYSILPS
jgi:hypothetical protein